VLAELLAGARDRDTLSSIEALEYDFRKAQRLLVPEASDWSAAGKVMARLAIRYDYEAVGRGRLLNDVLIAVSAGRKGVTVVSANARDFARIGEFHALHVARATSLVWHSIQKKKSGVLVHRRVFFARAHLWRPGIFQRARLVRGLLVS